MDKDKSTDIKNSTLHIFELVDIPFDQKDFEEKKSRWLCWKIN